MKTSERNCVSWTVACQIINQWKGLCWYEKFFGGFGKASGWNCWERNEQSGRGDGDPEAEKPDPYTGKGERQWPGRAWACGLRPV